MRLKKSDSLISARLRSKSPSPGVAAGLGPFRQECKLAHAGLRDAIRALCDSLQLDPSKPQDISRQLGINKNLTWKFARLALAEDAIDALPMIPGPEGIAIYLRAFELAGVSGGRLAAVSDALASLEDVVERHFGGRAELELVLDGLRAGANLEQSRRIAFRGMSGVFGASARARVATQFLEPSRASTELGDLTTLVGLAGLRRLRPMAGLPVYRSSLRNAPEGSQSLPLDGQAASDARGFLLREFSSFPQAELRATERDGRLVAELTNGPLGRFGEADLFFASVRRSCATLRATPDDTLSQFLTGVSIPSELLVSDLFVHHSIAVTGSVRASMHSTLSVPLSEISEGNEQTRLPIDVPLVVIESSDSALAAALELPAVPSYAAMVAHLLAARRRELKEFRLLRVVAEYPAVPSALAVAWDLPA